MASMMQNPKIRAIIERAKNIILKPDTEWGTIEAEPATIKSLYTDYVLYLALIPAVCGFIGGVVFGYHVWGITVHPPFFDALGNAVVKYISSLIGVGALGFTIHFLAPTFGAQPNQVQAFKLAVYSMTAAWLAGAFSLIPSLMFLCIAGLYSFYLLYLGLPRLMKNPSDKTVAYAVAVIVVGMVIQIVIHNITTPSMQQVMVDPAQQTIAPVR